LGYLYIGLQRVELRAKEMGETEVLSGTFWELIEHIQLFDKTLIMTRNLEQYISNQAYSCAMAL
jgi:hypothetical protein